MRSTLNGFKIDATNGLYVLWGCQPAIGIYEVSGAQEYIDSQYPMLNVVTCYWQPSLYGCQIWRLVKPTHTKLNQTHLNYMHLNQMCTWRNLTILTWLVTLTNAWSWWNGALKICASAWHGTVTALRKCRTWSMWDPVRDSSVRRVYTEYDIFMGEIWTSVCSISARRTKLILTRFCCISMQQLH